jgi:hypothetical protein
MNKTTLGMKVTCAMPSSHPYNHVSSGTPCNDYMDVVYPRTVSFQAEPGTLGPKELVLLGFRPSG